MRSGYDCRSQHLSGGRRVLHQLSFSLRCYGRHTLKYSVKIRLRAYQGLPIMALGYILLGPDEKPLPCSGRAFKFIGLFFKRLSLACDFLWPWTNERPPMRQQGWPRLGEPGLVESVTMYPADPSNTRIVFEIEPIKLRWNAYSPVQENAKGVGQSDARFLDWHNICRSPMLFVMPDRDFFFTARVLRDHLAKVLNDDPIIKHGLWRPSKFRFKFRLPCEDQKICISVGETWRPHKRTYVGRVN